MLRTPTVDRNFKKLTYSSSIVILTLSHSNWSTKNHFTWIWFFKKDFSHFWLKNCIDISKEKETELPPISYNNFVYKQKNNLKKVLNFKKIGNDIKEIREHLSRVTLLVIFLDFNSFFSYLPQNALKTCLKTRLTNIRQK